MHRKVQLMISGGIRSGADVAKALAMGADAVSIGTAALIALNCNRALYEEDYAALGTAGLLPSLPHRPCPVGITTQDPGAGGASRSRRKARAACATTFRPWCWRRRPGAGLRQVAPAEPRARGPGRADRRGRRDGRRAARRNELDPGDATTAPRLNRGRGRHGREPGRIVAKAKGIKYFLISFVDLFGARAPSWCPRRPSRDAANGAGFAGFATHLDMTPGAPGHVRRARSREPHPAALEAEVAWVPGDLQMMAGKDVEHAPRTCSSAPSPGREGRLPHEDRRRVRVHADPPRRLDDLRRHDTAAKPCYDQQALMRRYDDRRDLRRHGDAGLEPLPERP
jgi:hypothetical protein